MKKSVFILVAISFLVLFSCKKTKDKISTSNQITRTIDFDLNPIKPINGKLKGVVELGASGFNSFIINVDEDLNWEAIRKEFGNSLILDGDASSTTINAKLNNYIQKIVEFGVDQKDIHFVISSGAAKHEITKVISTELKNMGYVVNIVTPEEEGMYALNAVLPKNYFNAFVVDIGSGNTKISYVNQNKSIIALETFGSKYYKQNIDNEKVYNEVKAMAAKVPKEKMAQCFIIGGVPYKLAKSVSKEKERYTILSNNADDFLKVANEEGKKVQSGLNIYKAILESTKAEKIFFDSDANFTIGFLLAKTDLQKQP